MKPSKVAFGLVVAGGVIWVAAAVLYTAQILSCFSCGSVVVAPGISTAGYSLDAIHTLAWDGLYANLYVATIGVLAIFIAPAFAAAPGGRGTPWRSSCWLA